MSREDQAKYDAVEQAKHTPLGEFGRENAMDFFEQTTCLMPGGNRPYPFIVQALGLLQTSKQIHEEANSVLFGKNTFLILVEWEREFTFWRCENAGCYPPKSPCYIHFRNFIQIKHLYILVTNARARTDPMLPRESRNLGMNMLTVARYFKQGGNKLLTLKIRYTSCFDGEIDTVRDTLEDPSDDRPTMLRDRYGRVHCVKKSEVASIFEYCTVLEPLKALKGIAEDVKIRGDLPQTYIDELVGVLSVSNPAPVTKKKQATERAQPKQAKMASARDFMEEMARKNPGSEWHRDMAERFKKIPVKSPAVMNMLMQPPTADEMARYAASTHQVANVGQSNESADDDDDLEPVGSIGRLEGGIGTLHGKPVFEPVRPPYLE